MNIASLDHRLSAISLTHLFTIIKQKPYVSDLGGHITNSVNIKCTLWAGSHICTYHSQIVVHVLSKLLRQDVSAQLDTMADHLRLVVRSILKSFKAQGMGCHARLIEYVTI